MIRPRQGLFLVILFLLISCRQVEPTNLITPTPFEVTSSLPRVPVVEPIPISLTHLSANPEFFEGSTLQLAGEYQRLPILACNRDPHPGPASWAIIGEGLLANASGLDSQLRSLLTKNQPITVEGRWLRFIGPVGCGKSAPVQEVWYLSVTHVIEPYPLARATKDSMAQSAEPTTIAALPETTFVPPQGTEENPGDTTGEQATATPFFTATVEPIPSPTLATTIPPSPIPPIDASITPDGTGTSTPTAVASATATGTVAPPEDETGTPDPSPTLSPSPEGKIFNDKGSIDYEDLKIETLQSGIPDQWTLAVDTTDSITITVAPASNANIVISILDETGATIVDAHDQSPGAEVETIKALSITTPGLYEIYVNAEPAMQTDYALMVMNSDSYSFSFQGTLTPSSPRSASLEPDSDHFWFFPMSAGNKINIRVTPSSQADPYLELYDPRGSRVLTIDDTGTGETESLEDYEALSDGMYGIRVGEFDFATMTYQILLTQS